MTENKTCRVCGVVLDSENWYPSCRKGNRCICNECNRERTRLWEKANPGKHRSQITRRSRRNGHRPFNENKECSSFLGIHVAERVLSHVFKDVKRMPMNNPGYDVICNRNKLIDIKSSCQGKNGRWQFHISNNVIADFFLCLAFDNREDLNPLYAWLIPGSVINHLMGTSIHPSTIHQWDEYRLNISRIYECCDAMRAEA